MHPNKGKVRQKCQEEQGALAAAPSQKRSLHGLPTQKLVEQPGIKLVKLKH